jgi:ubiquinol-cytochrome c reductase cytochrome b subunit
VFGGEWPGHGIIGRLYPVHILLIPGLIAGLLAAHLAMVWRQKHTQFPGPGRTETNVIGERVWPGFAMKSIGLLFLTAGVITALG